MERTASCAYLLVGLAPSKARSIAEYTRSENYGAQLPLSRFRQSSPSPNGLFFDSMRSKSLGPGGTGKLSVELSGQAIVSFVRDTSLFPSRQLGSSEHAGLKIAAQKNPDSIPLRNSGQAANAVSCAPNSGHG